MSDAASFNASTLWTANLRSTFINCTSFDELEYFVNVKTIKRDYFGQNQTGSQLSSINLKNIETIDYNGFHLCKNLTSLGDISNLKNVEENVFNSCDLRGEYNFSHIQNMPKIDISNNPNLTKIYLPESTTQIIDVRNNTSLTYIGSLNNELNNITYVGWYAFENTPNLTSICNMPNLTSTRQGGFGNSSFSEINAPNLLLNSISDIFKQCKATCINISNNNSQIPSSTFSGCTNLKRINSDDDYVCGLSNITSIDNYAFLNCKLLASINLSHCTSIGQSAFENCISLTNIDLSSLLSIGNESFRGCTNLQTVQLSNQMTDLKIGIFTQCTNLISVTGLENVENIFSTFSGCSNLVSVDFTSNLKLIGDYAFNKCSKLTSIGNNVKPITIYRQAFVNCTSLINIDLSECTRIDSYAFQGCTALESINKFSDNITVLESGVFSGCTSLTAPNGIIEIPASVTKIDSNIFGNSSLITTLKFLGETPPELTYSYYFRSKSLILVPQSALSAYQTASTWQDTDLQNKIIGY